MNNETKNKLTSGTDQADLTSGNACWETPPAIFQKLAEDFGPFDVDLCADAQRALCPVWLGPGSTHGLHAHDALLAPWTCYGDRGYCNPPYGAFIGKILPIAKAQARQGFTSVFLIPMRVTVAFKAHILKGAAHLLFCDRRITFFEDGAPRLNRKKFFEEGKLVGDSAVFDSIVVRYSGAMPERPYVDVWRVPDHVSKADLERAAARLLRPDLLPLEVA